MVRAFVRWLRCVSLLGISFTLAVLSVVGFTSYAQGPPSRIYDKDPELLEHRLTVLETRMDELFSEGHETHLYTVMIMLAVSGLSGEKALAFIKTRRRPPGAS